MIESFININDDSKKGFVPILLFKATVDGDKAEEFHKKCDYMGATLTIVLSETGRRFGGYTSISWDKSKGNYCSEGINFCFLLIQEIIIKILRAHIIHITIVLMVLHLVGMIYILVMNV